MRSLREKLERGELTLSDDQCPTCETLLYVDEGVINTYVCPECRFEGAMEPLSQLIGALRRLIYRVR